MCRYCAMRSRDPENFEKTLPSLAKVRFLKVGPDLTFWIPSYMIIIVVIFRITFNVW